MSNKDIDKLLSTYREDFTPDVAAGLQRLHSQITPVRQLHARPRARRRWLSVAAAALVIIAAGLFFFLPQNREYLVNDTNSPQLFSLPDGSSVTLQSGSQLSYGGDFNVEERALTLEGQGYFEVVSDQTRPFIVTNGSSAIRVTGTAFNLRSYDRELEVEVSEGTVILENDGEAIPVAAHQSALALPGEPITQSESPHLNRHAWRTGTLVFENTPMTEVLEYFHDNWGVETTWAGGQACNYPVSGKFPCGDAGAVLKDIAKLGGISARSIADDDKHYEISGDCPQ